MPRKSNAAGSYTATPITLSEGEEADLQLDVNGNVLTTDAILTSVYDADTNTLLVSEV